MVQQLEFSIYVHDYKIKLIIDDKKIPGWMMSHHFAHAAYAFYTSNYNNKMIKSLIDILNEKNNILYEMLYTIDTTNMVYYNTCLPSSSREILQKAILSTKLLTCGLMNE